MKLNSTGLKLELRGDELRELRNCSQRLLRKYRRNRRSRGRFLTSNLTFYSEIMSQIDDIMYIIQKEKHGRDVYENKYYKPLISKFGFFSSN